MRVTSAKNGWIRLVLAASLSLTALAPSASLAKPHPYPADFVAQVQTLLFDRGSLSSSKVDAYIAKLKQKREEIRSLHVGDQALKGNRDPKKVSKKVDDEGALLALDVAIRALETAKASKDPAVIYEKAAEAIEIEGALRIKGKGWFLDEAITGIRNSFRTWKIPKVSPASAEASDLYDPVRRQYLSIDDIQALKQKNVDLSLYNPGPSNPYWEPQIIRQVDLSKAAVGKTLDLYKDLIEFPEDRVFYFDEVKHNDTKPKMNVYTKNEKGKKKAKFKLKWGAEMHSDPTAAALMMTMGFKADVTKYARDVKVYLGKANLSDIKREWETYYSRDYVRLLYPIEKFLKTMGSDQNGDYVVFREVLIEAKPEDIERIGGWNMGEFGHAGLRATRGLGMTQFWLNNVDWQEFNNNRTLLKKNADGTMSRHLIASDVGQVMGSMFGEKPDLYPWTMIKGQDEKELHLRFNSFQDSKLRDNATLADARWGARLIADLSREQIQAAVDYGAWPKCVRPIVVEKLISRRNDLVQSLGLVGARQADGRVIQLIPLSGPKENFTMDKLCDMKAVEAEYTSALQFDVPQIAEVVQRAGRKFGLELTRKGINSMRRFQFSGPQLGLSEHLIGDVIVDIDRTIDRNPNPTTEQDIYLVKDRVEIGIRLGALYGIYKDFTYTRTYTLVYPGRSVKESELTNGFIVNLLLPFDVEKGKLPEKYVLMTEHFLENGLGIQIENPEALISPVLIAGGSKIRLWRSVFDHRDPSKFLLYRDRSNFQQTKLEALARLFIFKIPVFKALNQWGVTSGRGAIFTSQDMTDPRIAKAVFAAMTDGDVESVEGRESRFELTNDFSSKERHWQFLFWSGNREKALDQIVMKADGNSERRIQFRTMRDSTRNFLGNKEHKSASVEAYADATKPGRYQINVRVMSLDQVTQEKHMESRYLSFMNGLSPDGRKVINLTPALGYTTNKQWGSTVATSDTLYTDAAVARILALTPDAFWNAVAASIGKTPAQIAEMRKAYREYRSEKRGGGVVSHYLKPESFGLTEDDAQMVAEGEKFMKRIEDTRRSKKADEQIKNLAEAVRNAVYVSSSGFYSSRILGALNRVAGVENLYSRNMITSPPFAELNLLEEIPMYGEIGKPIDADMRYLAFKPVTSVDLYTMFDGWF